MPIEFVFNGYYRSGTTVMYKIIRESNSRSNFETLTFCEPLHPLLFNEINNNNAKILHGFDPWDAYRTQYFKNIEEAYKLYHTKLRKKYGEDIIPFDLNEVKPLFNLLHQLNIDVILQPNRCHFILKHIAKKYDCKFIHIIRNPIDCWIGQTLEPLARRIGRYKLIYNIRKLFIGRFVLTSYLPTRSWIKGFYINSNYNIIQNIFKFEINTQDILDKMLVVWTYCNYHAFKQAEECDKGMVVYYEQVTKEPEKWFKIMSDFSGVNFDLKYAKILKPRITKDEKLRKHFVERLERLGLIDMVNEFYPPERWFG